MKNHKKLLASAALTVSFCAMAVNAQIAKPKEVDLNSREEVSIPKIDHTAFGIGEKLTYKLHYGFVDAGEAVVEVKKTNYRPEGRETWHVVGNGRTVGAFNWFFKVRDRYESYIDTEGIVPWKFVRRVEEGKYTLDQDYIYHQNRLAVDNGEGKTFEIPNNCQDMISAFYYARTLDFSTAKKGDVFTVQTFMDDEIFDLKIRYLGKETISLRKRRFSMHEVRPCCSRRPDIQRL